MSLQAVLDCLARMIAALDSHDADAIIAASSQLAVAIENLRISGQKPDSAAIELGLKQAEAARIRVKYLTAWNRQKIDRFAKWRGISNAEIYEKPCKRV
jgi:hypothetical protein